MGLAVLALALAALSAVAVPFPRPPVAPSDPTPLALDAGGGKPARFRGRHHAEVRHLLGRAPDWRTSRDARADGGEPPRLLTGAACPRDIHVAAAIQFAWAAESYYRLRDPAADRMASAARAELNKASGLCGGKRARPPEGCLANDYWGCPPPL